ncbi:ribbon-helix-helix protein, CopG family [Nocardia yamanashiensis]|uniref:ribbon-helix-helix protein, CopG family n=1 Tax=Nocardia yamanashiensis TaxID=209247 RepID=UPI001E56615E|nr:ribbon-helix-helix protein, CopG family [Nocardia yamanashiensis]UGT39683.1 ribbon-helix-helix protein, CopG family [Nocardia yamanashiensis]
MAWTMRFPADEEAALEAQAEAEGRSKHELTRDAVREYLMRHRKWDEPLVEDEDTFDMGGAIGKEDIHDAMNRPA